MPEYLTYAERKQANIDNAERCVETAHQQVESIDALIAEHECNLSELRRDRAKALRSLNEAEACAEELRGRGLHVPGPR